MAKERKWSWSDLVVSHQSGKLRETLVWSNAGKGAVLYAYLRFVTAENFETMTMVMGTLLIAHEVIKSKQSQDQQKIDITRDQTGVAGSQQGISTQEESR